MQLNINDTFNKELPADPSLKNSPRQVENACFSFVTPTVPADSKLVHVSKEVTALLGISEKETASEEFLKVFTGAKVMDGTTPYSMCYGGHQFGHWAGQLGDGRAINLTEVVHNNQRWALQLKGAGATPYSRRADGLAVLRSSIREHLCSEAMHHLGVPTTRSLSLSLSGDQVMRDVMYNGNSAYEKGAIVCRVSPSFIRFGSFEIFASRKDYVNLRKLTDYTIKHFYKEIKTEGKEKYIEFFNTVLDRTLAMVIHWQRVGFVHGVMNTDNLSILGLTIDYGPYGWLEGYDIDWTPNTTDRQQRRYRYGQQPGVALWNLFQLANALYSLVEESKPFEDALDRYKVNFAKANTEMMKSKLGLQQDEKNDVALFASLEETLSLTETDMTIFYRLLGNVSKSDSAKAILALINPAFYASEEVTGDVSSAWIDWLETYRSRLHLEPLSDEDRKVKMNLVNPKYVLRNYMAQLAIDSADEGDYSLISELHELLRQPYAEQVEMEKWFVKRPEWARHKVGCSMLSCSS
ncbi:MAG: YdiU family protein [Saprospiraceae bacterium]